MQRTGKKWPCKATADVGLSSGIYITSIKGWCKMKCSEGAGRLEAKHVHPL